MTVAREGERTQRASHTPLASVEDLRVHFRTKAGIVHAVDGVSFDIADGETLGLVGETGCGKSVTARSFLQLVPMPPGIAAGGSILFRPRHTCPDCEGAGCTRCDMTGRVRLTCPHCNGGGCVSCEHTGEETIDLLSLSESQLSEIRGDRIAMIFQDPGKALNPALSIRDQLSEVFYQHRSHELLADIGIGEDAGRAASPILRRKASLRARRLEDALLALPPLRAQRNQLRRAVDARVAEALAETQIPNPLKVMDRYPHELSGGMRQRVMIAQALACDPDLLIADEPTTALDVTVQVRILELIRELQQRHHTSVLYISHDLSLVQRVCDRVAVMYAGQIAESAPTSDIFANPSHPYTRGLIDAIPSASHERGGLVAIPGTVPELVSPPPACRFASRCPHEAPVCGTTVPQLAKVDNDHDVACFIHHAPEGVVDAPTFERRVR